MGEELDFEELPNSGIENFYKFKAFDEDGFYKDLLNNSIWLSSRTKLNDPEDCRVPFKYELCTDEEIKQMMFKHLPYIMPVELRNFIVEKQFHHRKNNLEYYNNSLEKFIDKSIGVFSLTQDFNDKMWDVYSDDHKGFCVELDANKLYESLENKFETERKRFFLFRVHYNDELPEINPCKSTLDQKTQMFLTKTKAWEYENEWRVVSLGWSMEPEPIEPDCITNIYFGLNASQKNIETSIEILKKSNPNIGLHKAVKKKDEFGLEFEKV